MIILCANTVNLNTYHLDYESDAPTAKGREKTVQQIHKSPNANNPLYKFRGKDSRSVFIQIPHCLIPEISDMHFQKIHVASLCSRSAI